MFNCFPEKKKPIFVNATLILIESIFIPSMKIIHQVNYSITNGISNDTLRIGQRILRIPYLDDR